ncbi:hypothetical protein [Lachnoclostridium edouardi]|uniref:hypothetical protein n=1 Tax=Lachnoclostridium edouardi TaxID=1926283 RepID=UPI000C7CC0E3|nr:hypothetical protein [Lachnoclostridium edouardi]
MKWRNKVILTVLFAGMALGGSLTSLASQGQAAWIQGTDSSGGTYWQYIDENGQAAAGCSKEINGGKYFFDQEGRMLWSWISEDGEPVDSGSGDGYRNEGVYYCGDKDDGRASVGWKYIPVEEQNGGKEKKWFYFRENGKKVADGSITEHEDGNQYRYTFDEDGIMVSSKMVGASQGNDSDGGEWVQHIPGTGQDSYGSDVARWYYLLGNGNLVKNQIRAIKGQTYIFDETGIMRTGLVLVDQNNKYAETILNKADHVWCDSGDLSQYLDEYQIMYFDETSGARLKGKIQLDMGDGTYTLAFRENGKAVHGPYQGYLYDGGVLQKADAGSKYEIKNVDDKEYLVNAGGKIQKKGRYKDKGDTWWNVEAGSDSQGYVITEE